jgi:hypothetical protein
MWIIHDPKKVALWNKRHFEDKNLECAACLKYLVLIIVENIYKMQHLEGSGTPVLYIGRMVPKVKNLKCICPLFFMSSFRPTFCYDVIPCCVLSAVDTAELNRITKWSWMVTNGTVPESLNVKLETKLLRSGRSFLTATAPPSAL